LILDVFGAQFSDLSVPNMYKFTVPDPSKLHFNGDLIHLTPKCGESYVYSMFEQSGDLFQNVERFSSTVRPSPSTLSETSLATKSLFKQAILNDSDNESFVSTRSSPKDDMDVTVIAEKKSPNKGTVTLELLYSEIKKTNDVMSKVNRHEKQIETVQQAVISGFKSSDLAIAKLYEDQDYMSNLMKENRVTICSLRLTNTSLPSDRSGWINFLSEKVKIIIKELFKDEPNSNLVPVLTGVAVRSTRINFKKEFPNFEAIFQNSAQSLTFRRAMSQSSKFVSVVYSKSVSFFKKKFKIM